MWPLSLVIEEVSIVWAKLNLLISALMGLSAALQYNDPDPLPWIAFYACAAFAGFTHNGRMGAFFCLARGDRCRLGKSPCPKPSRPP